MEVTVDNETLRSKKLNELDPEEVKSLLNQTAEEVEEEIEEEDSTLNLGSIGGKYQIGPIDVTVAIGNVVLLAEIDSPFIKGELEEGAPLDPMDCMKALYVLGEGKKAIKPIMAMKQRIKQMMMLKPMVEKNPDLFQQLLDRTEKIADAEKDFEEAARSFYEANFVGYDFQETVDAVFIALSDVILMSEDLPSNDVKKKDLID